MFLCPNCFADIEIKSYVKSFSSETGICKYCGKETVKLLPVNEILDFFEELLSLYKEEATGDYIIKLINQEWKLFPNDTLATNILNDILPLTGFKSWKVTTKVKYIDEIEENISYWEQLKESLKWERRFLVKMENIKDLEWDNFFKDQIIFTETERFYRAKIHHREGLSTMSQKEMGCPAKELVSGGRGNPQGIPYLYLSKIPLTTFYETRVLLHDEVSIGEFKVKTGEKLKVVDFTEKGSAFAGFGNLKSHTKAIRLKELIGKDLSKPIRRYDSNIEYVPTQFICEFIRFVIGADGILFNSSLHPTGQNLLVFNHNKMECIKVTKKVVTELKIDYQDSVF